MVIVAKYTLLIYALLLIIGGILGYTSGKSLISLLAGSVSGVVLLGVFAWSLKAPSPALWTGVGISAALVVLMGMRFAVSGKFIPAGIVTLISLAALVLTLVGALQSRASP